MNAMEELRHLYLEAPTPRGSVFSRLQSTYEAAIAASETGRQTRETAKMSRKAVIA